MTNRADALLADLRYLRTLPPESNPLARDLADKFAELDAHLSAGGAPPEAWREGPDAPELDDVECIWCDRILTWHEPSGRWLSGYDDARCVDSPSQRHEDSRP